MKSSLVLFAEIKISLLLMNKNLWLLELLAHPI